MQAVCFVMGWVFASGIGSWRCGSFCRRVGFTQGQLYAVVFVVRVFASGICSWQGGSFCRRVGFSQGQFSAAVFVVLGGFRKCKPWSFLRCGFLQAVLVPCGAFCFVVGWVAWFFFKKISRFGLLFIVNFYFQNSISRQQCTDSVQNRKIDTLARYISYSWVK